MKLRVLFAGCLLIFISAYSNAQENDIVSFSRDVRPIFASHCFGCHQGAIDRGGYVMTDFESMIAGGESGDPSIVPNQPDESRMLDLIGSYEGSAEMPPNDPPISPSEFDTIRRWIEQGAKNDYTKTGPQYSPDHPPVYSRLPVATSIDFSPDGTLLAVSGFHEVLILKTPGFLLDPNSNESPSATTGEIVYRLIGLSARIASIKFSPDGKRLAVAAGNPGEFGEIQIWDIQSGTLSLSKTVSHDTVYGVNWSPDGKIISFGCTDTTLRGIDSEDGHQVLYQSAHDDWIRDTVFSVDGSKLVSVGRDMSCKLTEVATQRFIDNVTSITPGVLKGGLASVDRHPSRDEVAIGGADGIPKIYRINRLTKRVIGDDANLIRVFPELPGRIQSISFSKDGTRVVAGSSDNGVGHVHVYSYEFDTTLPDDIKAIVSKRVAGQTEKEKKTLAEYSTKDVKQISQVTIATSGIYSVDFHPNGKSIAYAGRDGVIRFMNPATGKPIGEIMPIEVSNSTSISQANTTWTFNPDIPSNARTVSGQPSPALPTDTHPISLQVSPELIQFSSPTDYAQFVVQATYENGSTNDVTSQAEFRFNDEALSIENGFAQAIQNGSGEIVVSLFGLQKTVPVTVRFKDEAFVPDFINDVNPVLSKIGCNAGTCHGSQGGKKGFKLSLRGYDPIYDLRSLSDDMASRRIDLAVPEASLLLMKPSGQVPHEGGAVVKANGKYYQLIREWIRDGAVLDLSSPRVASIEIFPKNPILKQPQSKHQMRVVATYTDGSTRDVTRESIIEVGDIEIASVDESVITALRRGESPVLARYEGAYAATIATVMGNRDQFVWEQPISWGKVDDLVANKWKRMKIRPSELCSDDEFVRRIYLDLTGLPPTPEQLQTFRTQSDPSQSKRDALVDRLIGSEDFVEHWSNKWADLMQVNRKYLGTEGSQSLRNWIRTQVETNRPYDEFAHEILTASGSNKDNPPAAYYKIHRTPELAMENTTHLFLGTRFNCNQCHDHPFERWTQDQYYETAAFFAQVGRKKDPASGEKTIGGSAVESATPLYEVVSDSDQGEQIHVRTGLVAAPQFPFEATYTVSKTASRREELAAWITSPDNPYFATSYVNRLWGYLTGVGLIEPLDDIRAGNPPTNPQLLEYLRSEFVASGFDTRHVIRLICKSRTYQLSLRTNPFNEDDLVNYSHAIARRLPAEVLFDAIHAVTGSIPNIPGVTPGTRAAAFQDSGVTLPSGFLSTLGRPARESVCECERNNDLHLGSILALVSGPDLSKAINDPDNIIARLTADVADDRKLVDRLYVRILNRNATSNEIDLALNAFGEISSDHQLLVRSRDDRAKYVAKARPALEQDRTDSIDAAAKQLDETIPRLAPDLLEKETVRAKAMALARKAIKEHKSGSNRLEAWRNRQLNEIVWEQLVIDAFHSKTGRGHQIMEDGSVLINSDKPGKDVYTLTSKTESPGIYSLRLELLTDPSLISNGPGLGTNGNFVLTELVIEIAHPDRADQWSPIPVSSAIANFTQTNFDIANTIDGKDKDRTGWAIAGNTGKPNWATFQFRIPTGFADGSLLRFKLHQNFDEKHQLGRFRFSISRFNGLAGLGLTDELLKELALPQDQWSESSQQLFNARTDQDDTRLAKLKNALKAAKKPIPVIAEIAKLREKLARVSLPIPPDGELARLEKDVIASTVQLENHRLTAAQDLTWALINSPSFLFNH